MKGSAVFLAPALLTTVLLGAARPASAVPVLIEFSGTVQSFFRTDANGVGVLDPSYAGEAVSGWFLFETDGLVRTEGTQAGYSQVAFVDSNYDPFSSITSSVSFAGNIYDLGGSAFNGGQVRAIDSAGPVPCDLGCMETPDQYSVSTFSSDVDWSGPLPDGSFSDRAMNLFWLDDLDRYGYVNLTQGFDVMDILDVIGTGSVMGSFSESQYTCTSDSCGDDGSIGATFNISSVTAAVTAVPEPTTAMLFAIGLLGVGAARRSWRNAA